VDEGDSSGATFREFCPVKMNDTRSVAIIGYACRFPGADNANQFWDNLSQGRENITFFTRQQLLSSGLDAAVIDRPNYIGAKGVLDGADQFDANFFGMTRREAEILDPQQRILLECCWTALEHAGCARVLDDNRIGVYVGASLETYLPLHVLRNREALEAMGVFQAITSNSRDTVATRIAHRLNLRGPALTVQTACSTSLVTLHLACQALICDEADIAVAGGIKIGLPLTNGYLYEEGGILARDGHTRSFDAEATGCVLGDGVGIVILKRLKDAVTDRDSIHAIIRGSAVLNDGSNKNSFTAPSIEGQVRTIRAAFRAANVDPRLVSYVEAHGSGTKVGDPAELSALQTALERPVSNESSRPLAIGSVKSNIGHLDTAAGIAGLLKVVLALKNRTLPPSLHFTRPNPLFDWNNSALFIVKRTQSWNRFDEGIPLYASVNSLGIGGTNAHLVLEEAPVLSVPDRPACSFVVPIAAHDRETLSVARSHLCEFLEQAPSLPFADVARSLHNRRTNLGFRIAAVGCSAREVIGALRIHAIGGTPIQRPPPIVFLFPGFGGSLSNLLRLHSLARLCRNELVGYCFARFSQLLQIDLARWIEERAAELLSQSDRLSSAEQTVHDNGARHDQEIPSPVLNSVLFTCQYATAQFLIHCGLVPRSLVGFSFGELTAACLANVFCLEDAIKVIAGTGKIFDSAPSGSMVALALSAADASAIIGENLDIAAVTGPKHCIISGKSAEIAALQTEMARSGIAHLEINSSRPHHSRWVRNLVPEMASLFTEINLNAPAIPIYTSHTGGKLARSEATDPGFWASQITDKLWFEKAVTNAVSNGDRLFLEVGAIAELCDLATLTSTASGRIGSVGVALMQRTSLEPREAFLQTIADLWARGVNVDWTRLLPPEDAQKVPLPTYPFNRSRFWLEPSRSFDHHPELALTAFTPAPNVSEGDVTASPKLSERESPGSHHRKEGKPPPSGTICSRVCSIVSDAIGLTSVEESMSFQELGGTSLTSMAVASQIEKHFLVKLHPEAIYDAQSLVALAHLVQDSLEEAAPDQQRTAHLHRLAPNSMQRLLVSGFKPGAHLQVRTHKFGRKLHRRSVEEALRKLSSENPSLRCVLTEPDTFSFRICPSNDDSPCVKELPTSSGIELSCEEVFLQADERAALSVFLQQGAPSKLVIVTNSLFIDPYSSFDLINRLAATVDDEQATATANIAQTSGGFRAWQRWRYSQVSFRHAKRDYPFWLDLCRAARRLADRSFGLALHQTRLKFALDPAFLTASEDGSRGLLQEVQQLIAGAIGKAMAAVGQMAPVLVHVEGRDSTALRWHDFGNYCFRYPLLVPAFTGESNTAYMATVRQAFATVPSAGFTYHQLRFSEIEESDFRLPCLAPLFDLPEPVLVGTSSASEAEDCFWLPNTQTVTPFVRAYVRPDKLEIEIGLPEDTWLSQFLTTFEAFCAESLTSTLPSSAVFPEICSTVSGNVPFSRDVLNFQLRNGFVGILSRPHVSGNSHPLIAAITESTSGATKQLQLLFRAKSLERAAFLHVHALGTSTTDGRIQAWRDALAFLRMRHTELNIDLNRTVFVGFEAAHIEALSLVVRTSQSWRGENAVEPAAALLWRPRPPIFEGERPRKLPIWTVPEHSCYSCPIFCFIDRRSDEGPASWTARLLRDLGDRAKQVHLAFAPESLGMEGNDMTAQLVGLLWPGDADAVVLGAPPEGRNVPGLRFGEREPDYIATLSYDSCHFPVVYSHAYSRRAHLFSQLLNDSATYQIFLPPSYFSHPNARFPCIYWLHGLKSSQLSGDFFARFILEAIRNGYPGEWIAVFPNLADLTLKKNPSATNSPAIDFFLTELIPHIDSRYRTIPEVAGRALEGFSSGAELALQLSSVNPCFCAMSLLAPPQIPASAFTTDRIRNVSSIASIRLAVGTADGKYEEAKNFSSRLAEYKPHEARYLKDVAHDPQELYEAFQEEHPLSFFSRAFGGTPLQQKGAPMLRDERRRFLRRRVLVYGPDCRLGSSLASSEMAKLLNHLAVRGYDVIESTDLLHHGLPDALQRLGCCDNEAIDLAIISRGLTPEADHLLNFCLTQSRVLLRDDRSDQTRSPISGLVVFHPNLFLADGEKNGSRSGLSDLGVHASTIQTYAALTHVLIVLGKAESGGAKEQAILSVIQRQCGDQLHMMHVPSIIALINTGRLARFLDDSFTIGAVNMAPLGCVVDELAGFRHNGTI
jgi:phthiocerol/phenolphthiocerol synthesis type-I polyketide synthase E